MRYDLNKFGVNFKKTRIDNSLSIQQLSQISGISERTIINIEQNKCEPRIETLQILSFYLKVDLLELLLECKNDFEFQFCKLVNSFHKDLKNCLYEDAQIYLDEFVKIESQISTSLDPNQLHFLSKVQTAIYWIKGVISSTITNDKVVAEEYFLKALFIQNNNFCIDNPKEHFLSNLGLHVLNSLVVNRLRYNITELCEDIMKYIIHMFENRTLMDPQLYMSVLYNLSNLYLEDAKYNEVILVCNKYFYYSEKYNIQYLSESFLLLYEVSNYLMNDKCDIRKIEIALYTYLNTEKRHLIPIIKRNLKEKYGIVV